MKKAEVKVGGYYQAKVSGKISTVRITNESPHGGWDAVNSQTGRAIRVRSPQRLRRVGHDVRPAPTTTIPVA